MKSQTSASKAVRSSAEHSTHAAGAGAMALDAPAYAIDFVDAARQGPGRAQAAPGGAPPVQRMMEVDGEEDFEPDDKINVYYHTRASVHGWAKDKVKELDPFSARAKGSVCNHHWGYKYIEEQFLDNNVNGRKVEVIANRTLATYAALPNMHAALGTHKTVLTDADNRNDVSRIAFSDAMEYYIQKICDYPWNLFYWPDKDNDDEADEPVTAYTTANLPGGWNFAYKVTAANKVAVRDAEITRIRAGKTTLEAAVA